MFDKTYKLVCIVDECRIRGEDNVKKDYKKGDTIELNTLERSTFFRRNGWKIVQTTDASTGEIRKAEGSERKKDAKKAVAKVKKVKKEKKETK